MQRRRRLGIWRGGREYYVLEREKRGQPVSGLCVEDTAAMSEVVYRLFHTTLKCPKGVSDGDAKSAVAAGDRIGVTTVPDMPPANAWRLLAVERDRAH